MSNIFSKIHIQDVFDRDPEKFEPRPLRAWAIIFSVGVVAIILTLAGHFYAYLYMHTDDSFKPDESDVVDSGVKLNRKDLGEITAMLEEKNAKFQELIGSAPQIADPATGRLSPPPATSGAIPLKSDTKNATSSALFTIQ